MKMKILLACLVTALFAFQASGQGFVNKLKQKADEAASKALEKKAKEKVGINDDTNDQSPDASGSPAGDAPQNRNRPTNKGGGGLTATPPDVNRNLSDAETSYKAGSYGEARYAVQQAMLGVEMQIGQKVLESMPRRFRLIRNSGIFGKPNSRTYLLLRF